MKRPPRLAHKNGFNGAGVRAGLKAEKIDAGGKCESAKVRKCESMAPRGQLPVVEAEDFTAVERVEAEPDRD